MSHVVDRLRGWTEGQDGPTIWALRRELDTIERECCPRCGYGPDWLWNDHLCRWCGLRPAGLHK